MTLVAAVICSLQKGTYCLRYLLSVICRLIFIFFSSSSRLLLVEFFFSWFCRVCDLKVIANSKIYDTFVIIVSAPHRQWQYLVQMLKLLCKHSPRRISLSAVHCMFYPLFIIHIEVHTHTFTHLQGTHHGHTDGRDRRLIKVPTYLHDCY